MILESIAQDIKADLQAKGWFDLGRQHGPITVVDEYPDDNAEVELNTLAISQGDVGVRPTELGSKAETIFIPIFCDFFAESDGLGRHLIGDIAAHVNDVGTFVVYDYQEVVPTAEFNVHYVSDSLERTKPQRAVNAWQKHWYVCAFVVTEERPNA
jgi:hypothetical protein